MPTWLPLHLQVVGKAHRNTPPGTPVVCPAPPILPRPDREETAEPLIPTAWLHTFPTGLWASLNFSFHLHEVGALFPCPPTSQSDEGLMR